MSNPDQRSIEGRSEPVPRQPNGRCSVCNGSGEVWVGSGDAGAVKFACECREAPATFPAAATFSIDWFPLTFGAAMVALLAIFFH